MPLVLEPLLKADEKGPALRLKALNGIALKGVGFPVQPPPILLKSGFGQRQGLCQQRPDALSDDRLPVFLDMVLDGILQALKCRGPILLVPVGPAFRMQGAQG